MVFFQLFLLHCSSMRQLVVCIKRLGPAEMHSRRPYYAMHAKALLSLLSRALLSLVMMERVSGF